MKQLNNSMRASNSITNSPYRRILQNEMKRIAPIVPFVKGKISENLIKLSGTVSYHLYIHIITQTYIYGKLEYIHIYIYKYIHTNDIRNN